MTSLRAMLIAGLVLVTFGVAVAKLPAPPPMTDEQKAAAETAKAKAAAAAEAAKMQLAKAEDRVVARYMAEQKAKGKTVTPQIAPVSTGGAVTTAQGNTPTGSTPGKSADAAAPSKPPAPANTAATGPNAAKDSSKK